MVTVTVNFSVSQPPTPCIFTCSNPPLLIFNLQVLLQDYRKECICVVMLLFNQGNPLVEAQKRKAVDKNNPTLYWEYKWSEDAEAEVLVSVSM